MVVYVCSMHVEGTIYQSQSKYLKARDIFIQTRPDIALERNYAYAALNIAQIDIEIGEVGGPGVELNIATAQKYFSEVQSQAELYSCQAVLASLQLKKHNWIQAKAMFEECLQVSWSQGPGLTFYALEKLADITLWQSVDFPCASRRSVIYLVLSVRHKSKLNFHKSLRCLGDVLLSENDHESAEALFQVALEGFTTMDVHRSRAECMARMGELAIRAGRMDQAEKLWQKACILFERSSQTTQAAEIQRKLADLAARNKDTVLMSQGVL
ncbi:hypothetical protein FB45DRAFT_869158 [Roridomyces roridus]|uniref:Uncharacterized protein n=1 Tax=Roridomyces roridus TaxID=1738132 RepID=A0AAD7BND4_9AGAR|nr:hypothetical protein FB45DRAFT_869158 [Roridomyces roridus]